MGDKNTILVSGNDPSLAIYTIKGWIITLNLNLHFLIKNNKIDSNNQVTHIIEVHSSNSIHSK